MKLESAIMTIDDKLRIMESTPGILLELLSEIPANLYKIIRKPGKWCIHEHACHLYESQLMMMERFKIFKDVRNPSFTPYLPGSLQTPDSNLLVMDLHKSLEDFNTDRKELVKYLTTFTAEDWGNEGIHPEYSIYTPAIFLRHIMMHDHLHMYRIEELWLTTDDYL